MKCLFGLFILIFIFSGCSENLFDEIADKDTPEAVFFQAKQEIKARNYAAAISLLQSLDPLFLSDRERVPVHASAYSGRCGLEFLTLLTNLQNAGSATVLAQLMTGFPGATNLSVLDCIQAETIIEVIGDENQRNADENLLMAFNGLAKVGTILSSLADSDDDGTADAGFDQCDVTDFPEAMVRELGASVAVTLLSISAIGSSSIDTGDTLTDITDICSQDPNLAVFCTSTDPSSFSANEVQAMRYIVGSNDFGIDSCGGNNFSDCALANPACP